jgi:hypothetical protein
MDEEKLPDDDFPAQEVFAGKAGELKSAAMVIVDGAAMAMAMVNNGDRLSPQPLGIYLAGSSSQFPISRDWPALMAAIEVDKLVEIRWVAPSMP